jgi:hypothetical protein
VTGYHPSVTGAVAGIKTEIKTPSLRICEEFADDAAGGFRTRPAIPGTRSMELRHRLRVI